MRRIALAVGPVFALIAATVPAIPAQSATPALSASPAHHATTSHATTSHAHATARAAGLATSTKAIGATYVSVSWKWIRARDCLRPQAEFERDPDQTEQRSVPAKPSDDFGSPFLADFFWRSKRS